jgi:hypothetical protein
MSTNKNNKALYDKLHRTKVCKLLRRINGRTDSVQNRAMGFRSYLPSR